MSADNPLTGEATLVLKSVPYTLEYDWAALSRLAKKYGGTVNLFEPETLSGALEIGLQKHHAGMTADDVLAASPPVVQAISAFNLAMQRAYFGDKEPPPDAAGNPLIAAMRNQQTGSTASPAPSDARSAPASPPANFGS